MRAFVLLSFIAAAAALSAEEEGTCIVDGAEAVSDALDASMFIWASIARCGKSGEMVKCEIGVSSAIGSVNSMINVILGAVNQCGSLNTVNKECGMAMGKLTKHTAGIASASGMVVQKCSQGPAHGLNWNHADGALCVVNVKNLAKSLFKTVKSLLSVNSNCEAQNSPECVANALQIVGAFTGMGEYLAGAVGKCSPDGAHKGSLCAAASQRLVQQLTTFSEGAIDVSQTCGSTPAPPAPERLYSAKVKKVNASSTTNLLLAAFLPVTAIVGFIGGRVFGSRRSARSTHTMVPVPDVE